MPLTNINSKWIKDLIIKPQTMKLLEKNIEERLLDISLSNSFWGCDTKSTSNKNKN